MKHKKAKLDSVKEKELFYLDLIDNCVIQQEQIKELKALLNEYLNPDGQGNTFDDRVKQALKK